MTRERPGKNRGEIGVHFPLIAYALLIFILSSIPSLAPPDMGVGIEDKIAHVIEYAVLGGLLLRSAKAIRDKITPGMLLIVWLIGALYGITDEIHQYFVPNRFASPWDALADAIGVGLGMVVYIRFLKMRTSSIQHATANDEV